MGNLLAVVVHAAPFYPHICGSIAVYQASTRLNSAFGQLSKQPYAAEILSLFYQNFHLHSDIVSKKKNKDLYYPKSLFLVAKSGIEPLTS